MERGEIKSSFTFKDLLKCYLDERHIFLSALGALAANYLREMHHLWSSHHVSQICDMTKIKGTFILAYVLFPKSLWYIISTVTVTSLLYYVSFAVRPQTGASI